MTGFPVLLDLSGRRVVVVGGAGRVGSRRVAALRSAGALVVVVDPAAGTQSGDVARGFEPGDLDGTWLVVAATSVAAVNASVAAEALRRRVFCVRADLASGGTARVPAVGRREPVTVAVNAGDDPARAAALRDAILAAMDDGSLVSRPHRRAGRGAGSVALIGGGPGAPDLITVRGRRLLETADVVVVDRLAPRELLADLPDEVEVIDAGKAAHRHNLTQDEINAVLVDRASGGARVARLKGGDPFVFGRGGEELAVCVAAGIDVQIVPGVTSALAGPALAGIPLTHRGLAADAAIVSGHLDPGLPRDGGLNWTALATGPDTLVLLMAMQKLSDLAATLIAHGRDASTPAAVVHRASLPDQRVVRAPLGQLAAAVEAAGVGAPAVVVIGAVAGFDPAQPVVADVGPGG